MRKELITANALSSFCMTAFLYIFTPRELVIEELVEGCYMSHSKPIPEALGKELPVPLRASLITRHIFHTVNFRLPIGLIFIQYETLNYMLVCFVLLQHKGEGTDARGT